MSQANAQRSADEALMNIQKVGPYTIRPLSFGAMALVTPMLTDVTQKIIALAPEGRFGMVDALQIGFQLLPEFIPIMARILDVEEEEIKGLEGHMGMLLLSAIWNANERLFTDFFTLAATLCPKVGATAAEPTA